MRPPLHVAAVNPPPLPTTKEPLLGWIFHALVWLMVLLVVGGMMMAAGALFRLSELKLLASSMQGLGCRAIGSGWLAHDMDMPADKPSETFADVYDFAAMLAHAAGPGPFYEGEERDPSVLRHWFYPYDPAWLLSKNRPKAILIQGRNGSPPILAPEFRGSPVAWAVAIFPPDIRINQLPPETPLVWTRGLRPDGTWREDSPLAGERGFICFASGAVSSYKNGFGSSSFNTMPLVGWGTQTPTTNILEALPPGTRISEYVPPPEVAAYARWQPLKRRLLVALSGVLLLATCLAGTRSSVRGWKQRLAQIAGAACALWFWCEWLG
jgi:hypothetical protein